MFLHLGQTTMVKYDEIIGIFDLDTTTIQKSSRDFLTMAEKTGKIINVSYDLPKSFVICSKGKDIKIYISPISSATLLKRIK